MNNQAKQIDAGIEALGDCIAIPRTGFRSASPRPEKTMLRRVGEEVVEQAAMPSPIEKKVLEPKVSRQFDRITFEITPEQRANLTNLATSINFRVPREKRTQKINRDLLMRALLSVAERIDWSTASGLSSEEDIKNFISTQLEVSKKTADFV